MAKRESEGQLNSGPVSVWSQSNSLQNSDFLLKCLNRLVTGRDANIIITAASETGVGKTTLAVCIATMLDQHGWTADKAAVADAEEYDRLYDSVGPGSCLILDEAEKAADARRGMSTDSVELTQTFATKRYRQIFSILTAPSKSWVDTRLGSDAADFWVQALQTDMGRIKGEARVYRLKTNEHAEQNFTEKLEYFHWPNLDDDEEFQKLDQRKRDLLEHKDTDDGQKYLKQHEVQKKVKTAKQTARQAQRDSIIKELNENADALSQKDIAELIGLSKSRVGQIVNQDDD